MTSGDSLTNRFYHGRVSYEWVGEALHSAQPRQVPSDVQWMLTTGSNIPDLTGETSGLDTTRLMMH